MPKTHISTPLVIVVGFVLAVTFFLFVYATDVFTYTPLPVVDLGGFLC